MAIKTRITRMIQIEHPIVHPGMSGAIRAAWSLLAIIGNAREPVRDPLGAMVA